MVGKTLGHYEILEALGAGGMGEVYRARDRKLDRDVALKVLPQAFADDPERLARLEREAKLLAALNHPHIAAIHSLEEQEGLRFLVLELVTGESLAHQLHRGPLPIERALEICKQVAQALEAAHAQSIVHRDLKPANILLTTDGRAKVLDFGIAKSMTVGAEVAATARDTELTLGGRLAGTPSYMSPEHVRGESTDKRVDVWAFGCVLYEALTGRGVFVRETLADTLAAVVEHEPDWRSLPARTPPALRALLRRCLRKDRDRRLHDIADARIEIDDLLEGHRGAAVAEIEGFPAISGRVWPAVGAAAAVVALLAIGATAGSWWLGASSVSTAPTVVQQRLTELAGMEETPAVSPSGNMVAFVTRVGGIRQVFVRLLPTGSPEQISRGEVDHSFPRWADDNTLIYFRHPEAEGEPGSLWETLVLGSTQPRLIGPSQSGGDVSHSGEMIATLRSDAEGPALVLMSRDGTGAEAVYRLPEPFASSPAGLFESPRWSPDDRQIAFHVLHNVNNSDIVVVDLDSGEARSIAQPGRTRGIAWLPDGSGLVYASSQGSTLAYPPNYSLRTVNTDGSGDAPLSGGGGGYISWVDPDVTRDGKLVVSRVRMESDIFRFPVDGSPLENVANATRITRQTGQVQTPSVSPSGEEVAYLSDSGGHANVWVSRVDGSEPPRQITREQDPSTVLGLPVWSPRGDLIVYYLHRAGADPEEWLVKPDETEHRLLVRDGSGASWSSDGAWVHYYDIDTQCAYKVRVDGDSDPVRVRCEAAGIKVTADGNTGYFSPSSARQGEVWWASPVDTGTPVPLITTLQARIPMYPHHYALSFDDRWLATPLMDRGTTNLWLISTEDGSLHQVTDFQQRSTIIGRQVSWTQDGRYIFAAVLETDADIVLLEGALH